MTCPKCGPDEGILDVKYDLTKAATTLTRDFLRTRPGSIWRYLELLPVDEAPPALAHIGWTALIDAPRLAQALKVGRVRLKDDGRSASASFKDRASAVGVARAMAEGKHDIACASTGNAATSLAHCAAAAGLRARIFVGRNVPEGKLAQLLAYGASVFQVEGTYADAYALSRAACKAFGWYDRNCAVNPYLVEGKKTSGLEVAEQCADDPPDWVSMSVGDGCSIAGLHKGLAEMRAIGVIDWRARVLGSQAAEVAPIAAAFDAGGELADYKSGDTYADSINVPVPRNARKALHAVRESEGAFVTVTDRQIMDAVGVCGRLSGVFAEPAAAAAVAGVVEARQRGILGARSDVVIMITGNGLKDIRGALAALGKPHRLKPELAAVEAIIGQEHVAP
jgi:threonine synthase